MKIVNRTEDTGRRQEEASYIDEARRGEHRWWRYLLGFVFILVMFYVLGTIATLAVVYAFSGGLDPSVLGPVTGFVVTMAGFPFFVAGIALVVTRLHRRPFRTLITARERIDWRRVGHGFLVWLALWCLVRLGQFVLFPDTFSVVTDVAALALFVPLALVLTAIQTTTEELFFRGYVVQSASLIWRNRAFLALVSAVLFTLPHLSNPEVGAGGWLTVFFGYFLGTGLVWAVASVIDGTTELAIGAHFAHNIASILLVGTTGTVVSTPAVFTISEYDPIHGAVMALIIVPLFLVITLRFLKRDRATTPPVTNRPEAPRV